MSVERPPQYFTVEQTSYTIREGGAWAIFAGDAPRDNGDGTRSYSLRGPLLLMPPDMWSEDSEIMGKVAAALNDRAADFFESAKPPTGGGEPLVDIVAAILDGSDAATYEDHAREIIAAIREYDATTESAEDE